MADIKLNTGFTGPVDALPVVHTGGADVGSGGYLLSDGKSFMAPLPTVVSPSGSYRDRAGNLLHAVAFAATPASDPLLAPYLAEMDVQPTSDQSDIIDLFCKTIRESNVMQFDRYYHLHSHDEQASRINLFNPQETLLAPINAPTFVPYSHWKCDGSTQDLRTPVAYSFAGSKYTQDNASFGVFVAVQGTGAGSRSIAGVLSGSLAVLTVSNNSNGSSRLNDASSGAGFAHQGTRTGLWITTRPDAASKRVYYNKLKVNDIASPSSGVPAVAGTIGRSASAYSPEGFAAYFSGAHLTEADRDVLYDAIVAYRTEYVA